MPGSGIVQRPALHWLSRRVGDWRRSSSRLLLPTKTSSLRSTVNLTSSNAQLYLTMQTQLGYAPVSSFGYPRNTRFTWYALPSSAHPLFLSHIYSLQMVAACIQAHGAPETLGLLMEVL